MKQYSEGKNEKNNISIHQFRKMNNKRIDYSIIIFNIKKKERAIFACNGAHTYPSTIPNDLIIIPIVYTSPISTSPKIIPNKWKRTP